jgi:membrane-associated phospholipid phosphatase
LKNAANLRLLWLLGAVFVLLSAPAGTGWLYGPDEYLVQAAQSRSSILLDALASSLSALGGLELTASLLLALVMGLFLKGRGRLAGRLLLAFLVTGLLEYALKQVLPVPPVPQDFVRIGDFVPLVAVDHSLPYPSGHALRSSILLGAVYLFSSNGNLHAGIALALLGVLASRVYLGVHWSSDVAGGALLGAGAIIWAFRSKLTS